MTATKTIDLLALAEQLEHISWRERHVQVSRALPAEDRETLDTAAAALRAMEAKA